MSGHSKWKQIKYKKALTDAKKGKAFSKMARMITVAAKEKGPELDMNPKLRTLVEKARALGLPSTNIERAIQRGAGKTNETALEEVVYEAYGPEGSAFLLEGITDSKNRTTSEIKHLLTDGGGRLANEGSVEWLFTKTHVIEFRTFPDTDKGSLELSLIDSGAQEIREEDDALLIYTDTAAADAIKKTLAGAGITPTEEYQDYIPKNPLTISDEDTKKKIFALYEAFDDHDDVQNVYTNVEF